MLHSHWLAQLPCVAEQFLLLPMVHSLASLVLWQWLLVFHFFPLLAYRPAPEPRKGLCFGCYMRSRRGHETGPACECCGVTDRRVLRRHALDELRTLCANCSAVAGRRALSLDELRCEVFPPGDRRGPGRRTGDRRAPVDRRQRVEVEHLLSDADRRGSGRRTGDRLDAAAE